MSSVDILSGLYVASFSTHSTSANHLLVPDRMSDQPPAPNALPIPSFGGKLGIFGARKPQPPAVNLPTSVAPDPPAAPEGVRQVVAEPPPIESPGEVLQKRIESLQQDAVLLKRQSSIEEALAKLTEARKLQAEQASTSDPNVADHVITAVMARVERQVRCVPRPCSTPRSTPRSAPAHRLQL